MDDSADINSSDWSFTESLIHALKNVDVQSGLREAIFNDSGKLIKETIEKIVKAEIRRYDVQFEKLNERLENSEQYSRRCSLRITGLTEHQGENTDDHVIGLVRQELGINHHLSDTNRSHRVGRRKPGQPRYIIVKFVSHNMKYDVYWKRFKLPPSIFIREDLTKKRASLF
jgi:hypothetical protein